MKARAYLRLRYRCEQVVAILMIALLSPIFLVVALAILALMGRPVLYRQKRVGQYGRLFDIIKFRSMVPDAMALGKGYMPKELELVPPLGNFLRRSSLDELPQLINIARGEMSFIGPRPALEEQYLRYTTEQAKRVTVRQGLTGLAQVRYRNNATWSKRIEADLEYIDTISLKSDISIIYRTLGRLFLTQDVLLDQLPSEVDDLPKLRRQTPR